MFVMLHLKCFVLLGHRARWEMEDRGAVDAIPFHSISDPISIRVVGAGGIGKGSGVRV